MIRSCAALSAACAFEIALAASAPALHCRLPAAAADRLLRPGAILLLGEIHGTNESPAATARFVCAALKHERKVVLFVEIPSDEQPRIDAYLRSDGGRDAQHALIRGSPFWEAPAQVQDGRRSVAMLGLIDAARRWRRSGAPLKLLAFDAEHDFARRDRAMADRVRAERGLDPHSVLITFTGNIHNMLELPTDGFFAGIPAPMATHLADLHPVSIDLRPEAGGASWSCGGSCGVQSQPPVPLAKRVAARREARRSFSDVVPLAATTASIPAAYRLDADGVR